MIKQALAPHEVAFLKQLALAGGGLGLGAGAVTAYVNHLRNIKREVDGPKDRALMVRIPVDDEPTAEEDELYKSAGDTSRPAYGPVTLAMAPTAIALPGLLSYMLTRKAYQQFKAEELKRQLQDSEEAYVSALQEDSQVKQASDARLYNSELLTAAMLGGVPLSMLASAFLTTKLLEKHFPAVKSPTENMPRPLRIERIPRNNPRAKTVKAPVEPGEDRFEAQPAETNPWEAVGDFDKQASAVEALCRVAVALAPASSQFPDLLVKAARDTQACEQQLLEGDARALLRFCKGAATQAPWDSPLDRAYGFHKAARSAVAPILATLAAAEVYDRCPSLVQVMRHVEPQAGTSLLKEASYRGAYMTALDCLQDPLGAVWLKEAGLWPDSLMENPDQLFGPNSETPDTADSTTSRSITSDLQAPELSQTEKAPDLVDEAMSAFTGNT